MILLSILIPSIPSRFAMTEKLYNHLLTICEGKEIEVLLLMDNKKRSIGMKREALKNVSKGKYFMFCDDDDWVEDIHEVYEACKSEVDVITFKARARNNDGSFFIVTFGLENEVEHNNNGNGSYIDLKRPPFHQCAWHEKFRSIAYPDINYGEDWGWVEQALKKAKSEIFINSVVHSYNYDPNISEAIVETNQKRAIVNFATKNYLGIQQRLIDTINQVSGSDFCLFTFNPQTLPCPSHQSNPYAFKIYAIEKAREMGYDQVLWLDASVYAVKDIQPVWDWLDKHGVFFEEAGHWAGTWSPQRVLDYFGITKEEAMGIPMFSGGYVGLDFRRSIAQEFFAEWKEAMLNGIFKGSWDETRHDMTCGAIIAYKHGLNSFYSSGGQFFAYVGNGFSEPKESAVFHLQGI